jgi:hypothetical protein
MSPLEHGLMHSAKNALRQNLLTKSTFASVLALFFGKKIVLVAFGPAVDKRFALFPA